MGKQLYASGQIVSVALQSLSGPSTLDKFRIVRRYPVANRPDIYWVQSLADPGQRMVSVSELSPAAQHAAGRPYPALASSDGSFARRAGAA